METQSQASSAAEKKKRVETIVATKGSSARTDISEKAVASSTTSNGNFYLLLHTGTLAHIHITQITYNAWMLENLIHLLA